MCRERENLLDMDQFNAYYGLEEHLKAFRNIPLYEKLCCSWEVDKQKYINCISANAHRFPHYSDHGESHSKKIVSSMEFILGKKRIKQLSVADTWLLLQCAYTHDIGMSISANELFEKMAEDKKFYKKIKKICSREDSAREAFEFVQPLFDYYLHKKRGDEAKTEEEYFVKTNLSQRIDARTQYSIFISNDLSRWPLKLINAFSIILENYARPKHGDFSEELLMKELGEACENGIVPIRLRYLVARIASFHMKDRELLIETFPHEALGICNDYIHPRFAAIMLRLGDLLDLDNGRFNQSQLNVFGEKPYITLVHQFKHEAITHFLITPLKISVKADFTLDMADRLLKKLDSKANKEDQITDLDKMRLCMKACKSLYEWLQSLQNELFFLSINWLKIVPRKFEGSCPYFEKPVLMIDGRTVQEHELNLSYKITTKRAAEIIEGSGLYSRPEVTFLREVLQNALDATKLQMYRDVMSGTYPEFYDDTGKLDAKNIKKLTPLCFCEKLKQNLNLYRIEYSIDEKKEEKERNVICISIRDYGTGITYDDLTGMLRIGKSNKFESDQDIHHMPIWLKPTGSFGIGLQSIFYVAKSFKILSRPHFEKEHASSPLREMKFFSTRMGGEIEVTLRSENDAKNFGYGTEVKIEIDFQDDKDKLLLYVNESDTGGNNNYFDVFNSDMKQIRTVYFDYLRELYSNFIFPFIPKGKQTVASRLRCVQQNMQKNENLEILVNTFGDFCILTDHGIIKDCTSKTTYCFSCWSEKYKILIKYKPCTTVYGYAPNFTLYYKGICINSEKIKDKICIPFWDAEIHLFSEHTSAILEISRDEILSEKVDDIVDSIYRVHFCCLKFIFNIENMQLYERQLSGIWKHGTRCEEDETEQVEYLSVAKGYLSVLMYYLSNRESADIAFRDKFLYSEEPNNSTLLNCDRIAYYVQYDAFLRRRFVERVSELHAFCRIVQEEKADIWFVADKKLPKIDISLQYPIKASDSSVVIVEDYFYPYPQFAAASFKVLMINGWQESIIVYKIVGRSGELVKADEKDFWSICISLYKNHIKECEDLDIKKQRVRLVFPSNTKFEKISVTKLAKGIEHKEIIKFDSYIISPLPLDKLETLFTKCESKKGNIDSVLEEYFSETWIDENRPLLDHIELFGITKKRGGVCTVIENDCEVYLEYKTFLKEFLRKYINMAE